MIIRTRHGRQMELRSVSEWGNEWVIPQPGMNWVSAAGIPVTSHNAIGLPAVSNVIRAPSEIIASLPFMTYIGEPRQRAEKTWQWHLLHDEPDEMGTGTFTFFYDIGLSLEGSQNCFIQKARSRTRVEALYVIDPARVRVYRSKDTGEKLFDVYTADRADGYTKGFTTDDILHIRGFTRKPGDVAGTSLLEVHRDPLGNAIGLQGFEGDYFKNSAQSPFFFTGAANKAHAQELITMHNEQHQGVGKQFKVGALWGSATVMPIPMSMADAQYVESKRMAIEDACRIWRWPKELLEMSSAERLPQDENAWNARILKFYVLPRLKRIERAFAADRDLFLMTGLVGEFLTAALERADFKTRMAGYKDARQGGWATANEIRDPENLPPREDGDSLLQTPTGSAPNPVDGPVPEQRERIVLVRNGSGFHVEDEELV